MFATLASMASQSEVSTTNARKALAQLAPETTQTLALRVDRLAPAAEVARTDELLGYVGIDALNDVGHAIQLNGDYRGRLLAGSITSNISTP